MIGRPAYVHNVRRNDFAVGSELGNDLRDLNVYVMIDYIKMFDF